MKDLSPPRSALPRPRVELVSRPRLQAQLARALSERKLVLLSAPAGYGKTVALVQALHQLPADHAVAWVSVCDEDDLQRLLTNTLAALEPFDLPWRVSPEALPVVALRDDGLDPAADELAHALAQSGAERGVLAFDDMHRIADARVFAFFARLLRRLPPTWTLAMTSRTDPALPLVQMRVDRELTEFRQEDLCFQPEDVQALLQAGHLPATPDRVEQLLQRTQGWAVSLSMELLTQHQPHASARARWRTFAYLAEEVLDRLPQEMRVFLLRCSVLPELTVERCRQVCGDERAAHWLDELNRRSLFVTELDAEVLTLRLHDLFREFLQAELARERAEELPRLLRRAVEGEPDVVRRVDYLLRAGDHDGAIRQMLDAALPTIQAGAGEQLVRLADRFPAELREHSPDLLFVRALVAWHRWGFATVARLMSRAAEGFERGQRGQLATKARALGSMALFHIGRSAEAVALLDAAHPIDREPGTELVWQFGGIVRSSNVGPHEETPVHVQRVVETLQASPDARDWMSVMHTLFPYVGRCGVMKPLRSLVDLLAALGGDDRPLLRGGFTSVMRAWLTLWQGDLPAARAMAAEADADAAWAGSPASLIVPQQLLHAMCCQLSGAVEDMRRTLVSMARVSSQSQERRADVLYLGLYGGYCSANEDWASAREVLETLRPPRAVLDWAYFAVLADTLQAELALHEGRTEDAVQAFRQFGPKAIDCDWWGLHARVCVAWARAEWRAGDAARAWAALSPALREAVATGEVLGLLLCGSPALAELSAARWPDTAQPIEVDMLRTCAVRACELRAGRELPAAAVPSAPAAPPQARADMPAGLSDREREVLRRIAAGQSNKHIARELELSPHTIKRHVAQILAKTHQHSRGQAAAWWHAEGGGRAAQDALSVSD